MGLLQNKEWKIPENYRAATNEELELYMKYCLTAKNSQKVFVTSGLITEIITHKFATSEMSGAETGLSHVGVGRTMSGAMNLLQFKIDFMNGYKHIISGQCVLYTRNSELVVEVEPNTECKMFWIKKMTGFEFRFAIPDGVNHNTPITWCRMCAKQMRTEDLKEDGLCIFCHKPVDSSFLDFLKD